jgi:hypothetical protein
MASHRGRAGFRRGCGSGVPEHVPRHHHFLQPRMAHIDPVVGKRARRERRLIDRPRRLWFAASKSQRLGVWKHGPDRNLHLVVRLLE